MKRSVYLSLIKVLTLEIKADKYSLILLMQRGFIYLQNKNYQQAIYDFNMVIKRNGQIDSRIYSYTGDKTYFIQKDETEKAIDRYSTLRSYAKELMDFEEDIFNLLPIKNNQILNQSIKLIDFSLGITRKNRN